MGRLNLWGGGQVVPIMNVDAHGRVKWFWGAVCGVGSWGPKSGFWPVAEFWAHKALFGMLGPVPLADLYLPDLAWHFGSMTLEVFWSS